MRIIAILAGLALAACAQQQPVANLGTVSRACDTANKPFIEAWPCVRAGASKLDAPGDVLTLYIATGDFVAEQVASGKMTDKEAALAMARAQRDGYDAIDGRIARARQQDATDLLVLGSVLRQPQPTPVTYYPTGPQIIATPRGSVTCQRTSAISVYCG